MSAPLTQKKAILVKGSYQAASAPSHALKRKTPRITLRLTEDELAKLKNLSSGMSLSAYIRQCLFGKHAAPRKVRARVPVKDQQALARILGLLGKSQMAASLKTLAHEAECGSLLLDEQTEKEIKMACAHIAWIRVKLIEALGIKVKS